MYPSVPSSTKTFLTSCSANTFCHHDKCPGCTNCNTVVGSSAGVVCNPTNSWDNTARANLKMEICNERFYKTSTTSTTCTNCALNRYNCQGTSSGTRCNTDQWRDVYSPQDSCEACPAGYQCTNYALETACSEGWYSENGDTTCNLCGINEICSTTAVIGNCPDGTYSLEGRSSCSPCPVGYQCSGSIVTPCSAGTYSPMGQSSCQNCPSDSICNGKTLPIKCPPGKRPNGQECETDPSVAAEVKCKLGWVCPNDNDPYPCPPGTYSNGNSCVQCSTGTYCPFPELTQGTWITGPYHRMIQSVLHTVE